MPKDKSREKQRHDPLHKELSQGYGTLKAQPKAKEGRKQQKSDDGFVNAAMSKKILDMAKDQQEEIEREEMEASGSTAFSSGKYQFDEMRDQDGDEDQYDEAEAWYEEETDEEYDEDEDEEFQQIQEVEIDENDDELFNKYVGRHGDYYESESDDGTDTPFGGTGNKTLADKIMAKVREKEIEAAEAAPKPQHQNENEPQGVMLPPKVIETFTKVGELLSRYRSGKLPKVFKMVPTIKRWQDVLYVMQPESWTPQAVFQATRLFVSNLPAGKSQKFVEMVLLERFREDIRETQKVNYHTYQALKKALYKPQAFFKGFLFPLCESNTCTVREAKICGKILKQVSIPLLHSAAALMHLCAMEYSGSTCYFIKTLYEKKYALPYKVVDESVNYFMQFRHQSTEKKLPVIWHQCFLEFAQRYKNDITPEQRDALLDVVKVQFHSGIGPEIRRELVSGVPRGEAENAMELV